MKDLAEILEEEFSEAVEVKNPKSLHCCFALLTGTYVEQGTNERRYNKLSSSIKEMLASMKEGFRRVDERFAAQDKRFEALQKQMDERFTSQERQINRQYKLISLGFTAMVLIIAAFNLTIILS